MVKVTGQAYGKELEFSKIANGKWFFWWDRLGVKLDQKGYYPNQSFAGSGNIYATVRRARNIKAVDYVE